MKLKIIFKYVMLCKIIKNIKHNHNIKSIIF